MDLITVAIIWMVLSILKYLIHLQRGEICRCSRGSCLRYWNDSMFYHCGDKPDALVESLKLWKWKK